MIFYYTTEDLRRTKSEKESNDANAIEMNDKTLNLALNESANNGNESVDKNKNKEEIVLSDSVVVVEADTTMDEST